MRNLGVLVAVIYIMLFLFPFTFVQAEEVFCEATAADFEVSPIFCDNMVFQQNEPIRIWGTSDSEGGIVNARMGLSIGWGEVKDGKWEIELSPRTYTSEPAVLEIFGGEGSDYVAFENILIGDVWWVVGQSNVEFTVSASKDCENVCSLLDGNENVFLCDLNLNSFESGDIRWRKMTRYSAYSSSAIGAFLGFYLDNALNGEVPIAIISMGYSGSELSEFLPSEVGGKNGRIYKKVISNALRMPIRGMIWYQGESDANKYDVYAERLDGFIDFLREKKELVNESFPVYAIELSPCFDSETDAERVYVDLGIVRGEIGALTHITENFYVCPTSDLWSDKEYSNNIHPDNKLEIAQRLSLMLLSKEYVMGNEELFFSPTVRSFEAESPYEVTLYFENTGEGLCAQNADGFTVIGKKWDVIDAQIDVSKDTVKISADEEICIIRYATQTDGIFGTDFSLANSGGIPAAAFSVTVSSPEMVFKPGLRLVTAVLILFLILVWGFALYDVFSSKKRAKRKEKKVRENADILH